MQLIMGLCLYDSSMNYKSFEKSELYNGVKSSETASINPYLYLVYNFSDEKQDETSVQNNRLNR